MTNEILNNVKPKWSSMWKDIFKKYNLNEKLENLYCENIVFPEENKILETFKYFDLDETKLVFLGQDPYINSFNINGNDIPQAMGMAFSVPNGIKPPPSLKNIYKKIKAEYESFDIPEHGNLTRWVKDEKILLLNTALTVNKGESNSHQKIWNDIINEVIEYISDNSENVIFLLLGNNAKNKIKYIEKDKHIVVTGIHPSPLSASRGFFDKDIFKKINEELLKLGKSEIDWSI